MTTKQNILLKIILNIDDYISSILMAVIILITVANVFMRYIMGTPWAWAEEVTIAIFVWLTLFGAASVIKGEGHCSIDVLVRKLPDKARIFADIISNSIVILTLVLMLIFGIELSMEAGSKITSMLKISYTYIDMAVPIASIFMIRHYFLKIWLDITKKEKQG